MMLKLVASEFHYPLFDNELRTFLANRQFIFRVRFSLSSSTDDLTGVFLINIHILNIQQRRHEVLKLFSLPHLAKHFV